MVEKVYEGFLSFENNGEEDGILFLEGDHDPLAKTLEEDISGKFASVRYFVSDRAVTLEKAKELFTNQLFGMFDAQYHMHYSEITGYLWTDEKINVGGHDLLKELSSHVGKHLILIVDTNNPEEKERQHNSKLVELRFVTRRIKKLGEELGMSDAELLRFLAQKLDKQGGGNSERD